MQNANEVYSQMVKKMPSVERLRLATLILENLTEEKTINFRNGDVSAWHLLEFPTDKCLFQTVEEC